MKSKLTYEPSTKVLERKQVVVPEMDDNGNTFNRVSYKDIDVSSDDYIKDLPRLEEYTLSNLMAAGIPLEQLNPSGLLSGNLSTTLARIEQGKAVLNKELEANKD